MRKKLITEVSGVVAADGLVRIGDRLGCSARLA